MACWWLELISTSVSFYTGDTLLVYAGQFPHHRITFAVHMIMFWIACFIVISFVFLVFVEQTCTKNSIELHEDPNEQLVDELAAELGLRRVGWIFTDLVALDLTKGTVKHTRGNLVRTILLIVAMALGLAIGSMFDRQNAHIILDFIVKLGLQTVWSSY